MSQIYADGQHELLRDREEFTRLSRAIGVNKYGLVPTTTATLTDVWDLGQGTPLWVPPTVAQAHEVSSGSTNDTLLGTGARTLRLYGLTDWDTPEVSEVIEMDGTSTVTTANNYVIVHRAQVLTFGSLGENDAAINIVGASDATTTAHIQDAVGQTLMAIYGIPSTQTLFIYGYYASLLKEAQTNNITYADFTLTYNAGPDVDPDGGWVTKHRLGLSSNGQNPFQHIFDPPYRLSGPGILKLQVDTAASLSVSGGFDLVVVDN